MCEAVGSDSCKEGASVLWSSASSYSLKPQELQYGWALFAARLHTKELQGELNVLRWIDDYQILIMTGYLNGTSTVLKINLTFYRVQIVLFCDSPSGNPQDMIQVCCVSSREWLLYSKHHSTVFFLAPYYCAFKHEAKFLSLFIHVNLTTESSLQFVLCTQKPVWSVSMNVSVCVWEKECVW